MKVVDCCGISYAQQDSVRKGHTPDKCPTSAKLKSTNKPSIFKLSLNSGSNLNLVVSLGKFFVVFVRNLQKIK